MIESLLTTKSLNNNKNKDTTSGISNALSEITKIKELINSNDLEISCFLFKDTFFKFYIFSLYRYPTNNTSNKLYDFYIDLQTFVNNQLKQALTIQITKYHLLIDLKFYKHSGISNLIVFSL